MMISTSKIYPCLWFDGKAEEAANFYVSLFPGSAITAIARYPEQVPGMGGQVMTAAFHLGGNPFLALNGGPHYKLSPAVSFVVNCDTQEEIDHYWDHLGAGGQYMQCGWLTDQFGVSWQVVPRNMAELMTHADSAIAQRRVAAMMKMVKIEIAGLEHA